MIRKILCFILIFEFFMLSFSLSGCGKTISDYPETLSSGNSAENAPPELIAQPGMPKTAGDLYGSYLTMYIAHTPPGLRGLPYIRVFRSYADVENYYNSTESEHIYARLFTLAMASFNDDFFKTHDALALVINEPSCYINHTAEPIEIYPDKVRFSLTRHTPEAAPLLDTEYHLLFTATKGAFEGIDELPVEVDIEEIVDSENNSAFDSDPFRMYRPEFTSFCYRADALTDDPEITVDAIDGYDELVYFYDEYKDIFDLDHEFRDQIGTLYNWEICERYILLMMMIPCKGEDQPKITDLFVDDLKIYATVSADSPEEGEEPDSCWLVLCGIERNDLIGADLNFVYISVK